MNLDSIEFSINRNKSSVEHVAIKSFLKVNHLYIEFSKINKNRKTFMVEWRWR